MRIAIDARELQGRPTGVGRYLGRLLSYWLTSDGDEQFVLYHNEKLPTFDWMDHSRVEIKHLSHGLLHQGIWWQQVVLSRALKRSRPDVLFAPNDSLPFLWEGPSVVTVHDISYEAYPEWFDPAQRWRRRLAARRSMAKATKVLAVSHFTKDELIHHYRLDPALIEVVYHGDDDSLSRSEFTPEKALRKRLGLGRKIALVVGSIFERRFPKQTIGAFQFLKDVGLDLVIVGEDRRRWQDDLRAYIESQDLSNRIFRLDYCSEKDLLGLYRIARLLIYLSEYEGFGLPPLEAMGFGVPCVVSGRGALKEIYEGAALLVAEESEKKIASAVCRIALDEDLRSGLIAEGAKLRERLTLSSCAKKTLEAIKLAARQGK